MNPDDPNSKPVASPCIGVCQIATEGWCSGCYRTMGEIACWGSSPPADQRRILEQVNERRAKLAKDAGK